MIGDLLRFRNILGRSRTVFFSELALAAFQCEVDLIDIFFDQTFIGSDAVVPRLFRGNFFIRIRRTVRFYPFSVAVIHLCRRAAVPKEGIFVDIATADRACAPERARGHGLTRRRRLACEFLTIEDIAVAVDEAIVLRFPRPRRRAVCQLDVLIGDVAVDLGVARSILVGIGRFVLHVLRRDVAVVELQILRAHDSRKFQNISASGFLRIDLILHIRCAVVRLVEVLAGFKADSDRLLEDVALELFFFVDFRRIELIVSFGIAKVHFGTVDIDSLVVTGVLAQARRIFPAVAESHSISAKRHIRAVTIHKPLGSQGNIACLDRVLENSSDIRLAVILALDLAHLSNITDDLARGDIDVRTRDVVAVLSAEEHGFLARIAPAATAAFALRICFVQFHKAAILRAVKLDVMIIRRIYARDGRVVVAILMRDSQIVGIVGASDVLAPIALRTCALDIAAVLLILRLHRIAGSDIVRMPVIRLLKIGIRILRLHRPFHKGGKKRCRLPREDAPRRIRAALVRDVPTGISFFLVGLFTIGCKILRLQARRCELC